jgi:uncharacterized membrane protein
MINEQENHLKKLDRMATFIDAVLAIAITLLVLDLRVPVLKEVNSTGELAEKLAHLLPHFYAFLLCFLALMQYWVGSNAFLVLVVRYTNTIGVLNVMMLLPFCLLPFSASIIGEYPDNPGSYVLFGGLYFYGTIIAGVMTYHYRYKNLLSPDVDLVEFDKTMKMGQFISPIIPLLIIGSAFISTKLCLILFVVMLSLWLYMTKMIEKLVKK